VIVILIVRRYQTIAKGMDINYFNVYITVTNILVQPTGPAYRASPQSQYMTGQSIVYGASIWDQSY